MKKQDLIKKITAKKEFSEISIKDIERALDKIDNGNYLDEEKIKLTRDLLRRVFSGFSGKKILSAKNKPLEWFLKKHLSTRERFSYYCEVYSLILEGFSDFRKGFSIIDLGAGVNGLSYKYIKKVNPNASYLGVESIGQFVDLMNRYFKENKFNAKAVKLSLFELDALKNLIKKQRRPRIVFLLKVVDSLELLERDYTKKLILNLKPFVDRFVLSYATKSFFKREGFKVKREWIRKFLKEHFEILREFEFNGERYIIFE